MEKLNNTQTKDKIADVLRKEIISGRLTDGSELTQEQIAEILKVSRMPVREAFQILETEGFLLRLRNRHVIVVGLNKQKLHENLQLIASVELDVIVSIRRANLGRSLLLYENEKQFHEQFIELCNNPYLVQVYKKLLLGYPNYYWNNIPVNSESIKLHKALLEAINQDCDALISQLVRNYYEQMADTLLKHI